jgi:1-acyl-sn-glycerol-3-phosphate acyltransferase
MGNFSQLWLALLVVVALIYGLWLYFRSEYSTWESLLYLPAYLLTRLLWRVHFTNQAPQQIRGGAVLAANHRSSIDPMFIQLAAGRRVHWMVAKEYCQNLAFGPILRALQVIPTNRTGTDINSTKIALKYAGQNSLVGMFPEGRINITAKPLLPVRAGAAMVAVKAGVPIIPIYIQGSPYLERFSVISPFLMPARVSVTFGKPIFPNPPSTPTQAVEPPSEIESVDTGLADFEGRRDNSRSVQYQAAELIGAWARAMVDLAGAPEFDVPVGSPSKRRENAE